MFFPYSTDAPIYYWPITTVLLIAVNVLVFLALPAGPELGTLILTYGDGLHPTQWITSNFIHGGIYHLVGNMLSLWAFGLVVEGKLGWYKTLAVFLGIGAVQCAVEQILMLGSPGGGSFGASAVIFGFMAMSLVWAPENQMQCLFLLVVYPLYFEMKVALLVGLFLLLQVATAILTKMAMSSEVLHLIGAAAGFAVAIGMLKRGLVDCENWDIFSVWAGRHTMTPEEREAADAPHAADRRQEDGGSLPPDGAARADPRDSPRRTAALALRAH